MSNALVVFHGDLMTVERLDTAQDSRRIEDTPKHRFQGLTKPPALFHFKMAGVDTIWCAYILPDSSRHDENSLFQHVGTIRPNETGKFSSKTGPGFRRMHKVIQHDLWASMLNCWRLVVCEANTKWTSLELFAKSKPSWELIVQLSEEIVEKYVATTAGISGLRRMPEELRDQIWENQCLRNRDELLYVETSHAMNAGDIGRVEQTFLQWIYMFRATGKHKYSAHLLWFLHELYYFYPADVLDIIRMNWLVNPTGKGNRFRGVDWVVERNNLYTKVIYGGGSSNHTIERIIEESVLIELFRDSHVTIENGFHLKHTTICHSPPNMVKTLQKLESRFDEHDPNTFKAGWTAKYCVPDTIAKGMEAIYDIVSKNLFTIEDLEAGNANTQTSMERAPEDLYD
ncbi:hypothetical protein FA15DRAFT_598960 [Coprinopsis marcescibilis]|uniref:DUF6589 domain-containing protein n=1 Tax=Coprinopsis marcescibilis TaxID=230819 RepID=A0A5C3KY51_COPMA|nr:hypothetical protein FA15DRAFT_598960 [Coprinopsis marcescibilis]